MEHMHHTVSITYSVQYNVIRSKLRRGKALRRSGSRRSLTNVPGFHSQNSCIYLLEQSVKGNSSEFYMALKKTFKFKGKGDIHPNAHITL